MCRVVGAGHQGGGGTRFILYLNWSFASIAHLRVMRAGGEEQCDPDGRSVDHK